MMTRFLPRWPLMLDVRLWDVRPSFRSTVVRTGRPRVRPYLVVLEDRVAPAAGPLPLRHDIDAPGGVAPIVTQIGDANPTSSGIGNPEASVVKVSASAEQAVDVKPLKVTTKHAQTNDDTESARDTQTTSDASIIEVASGIGRRKNAGKKVADGGESMKDLKVLIRATARSSLVPILVVSEAAAANANGVPFVDRIVPPAATNPLPPTASPRATEATGRPQPVTSPPDTVVVTPPTVTGPPTATPPSTSAPPTAVPVTAAPVTGGLTPVRDVALSPSAAAGLVLANFLPSALDLPRSGGGGAPSASDAGARFTAPNTGLPVDNSTPPGRSIPFPTAGSGAGVVTEELPDLTLPAIELVPSGSDQSTPMAPIENGVSGTAVFVATVAAVGLLAGAYYSQARRSGRGPRLRVQG